MSKILVVGSSNTDMVIKTKNFPLPGETVLGGEFMMNPGGKGANQAVSAARLGAEVSFLSKVGNDIFGKQALQNFKKEGINTDFVFSDPDHPSGIALITVDHKGENNIVVAPGANGALTVKDLQQARSEFEKCEIVLIQLEIPIETVVEATEMAVSMGKKVVLNPAPAALLPQSLYKNLYLITPNKSELEALTGVEITDMASVERGAMVLREKGVENVVVTLGSLGSFIYNEEFSKNIPRVRVEAVDTTAAGDIFNGALCVALSEGQLLDAAVEFANRAAAISVTKMGAQASAPFRQELNIVKTTVL